jgi:hypothetical protein
MLRNFIGTTSAVVPKEIRLKTRLIIQSPNKKYQERGYPLINPVSIKKGEILPEHDRFYGGVCNAMKDFGFLNARSSSNAL